jgi:hypothetical protein
MPYSYSIYKTDVKDMIGELEKYKTWNRIKGEDNGTT